MIEINAWHLVAVVLEVDVARFLVGVGIGVVATLAIMALTAVVVWVVTVWPN